MGKCKRCHSEQLYETSRSVETLNEGEFKTISGLACAECECFHFNIGEVEIFEFYTREEIENNAAGKYITDYDLKRNEAQRDILQ